MGNIPFSILYVGSFHIATPAPKYPTTTWFSSLHTEQQPKVIVYIALQPSLPEGSASHTGAEHLSDTILYFKTFYFPCLRLVLDDVGASCQSNFPALNFKAKRNLTEISIRADYALNNYTTIPLVISPKEGH